MKHTLFLSGLVFVLFSIVPLHAHENSITQQLNEFSSIKAFDGLSINLIQAETNKAVITGENTNKVAIINKDGELKIRMELGKIFSGYRTFIDLYYTGELMVIDANEDARVVCDTPIKQSVLELKTQEGAEVIINAFVEQLLIKSVTGGIITTNGSADTQDVIINTGGTYEGKALKTKFTTVAVNAGGNASIQATNYVKATVKAGGEVLVYGNPEKMDEKTVFGGKITRM